MPLLDVFEKINSEYYQLTSAEKKVADYAVIHQQQTQFMSISELAEEYGLGVSTVKKYFRQMYGELWERIKKRISCGEFRMLVIDEFMAAYRYGLIDREEALKFLTEKPEALEIVLTGRDPAPELTALADYVSEIRKVKHPFDQGILARRGIEY